MTTYLPTVVILLAAVTAVAQQAPSSGQLPDNGAEPAMEDSLRAPGSALLGGNANSLAFSSELERSNYIRGGIALGATYDDNAASTGDTISPIGDFSYSVLPNIELDQTRSRLHWTLAYFGGFTANQRLSAHNQGSHNLTGTLMYRLSPHIDLHLSDSFLDTTGFLQQFQNGEGTPVTGPVNQPNPTLITPLAKNINNTAVADLSYQFSADDQIGGGGTFYDSHFRDLPPGSTSLQDTSSRSGDAYYNHRFTPRNWTGVTYKFQRLAFAGGAEVSNTHSVLLSHTIYLRQHMTLSFFVGPEYSELATQTLSMNIAPPVISFAIVSNTENHLSASGGASFGWQGRLTSVRLNGTRKVSDGGGVIGTVELTSVDGSLLRQIAKATSINLNALYGRNRELGTLAITQTSFNSATFGTGLEQRFGANFVLRLGYGRDYLSGGTFTPSGTVNHNRGTISISYNFTRPMGR